MSESMKEMPDDDLVMHYRDMQHMTIDVDKAGGVANLAYYQGIVREMARRFAIVVENRDVENEEAENDDI